jgi:hypothetical protein
MSDTCYCELRIRKDDQERFEELGFGTERSYEKACEGKPYIDVYDEQCNYGAQTELEGLATEGIPFYGAHGAGDDYQEAAFASADGEIAWPTCRGGCPAVRVTNGPDWFDQDDIEEVETYYRLLKRAKELLGEVNEDPDLPGDHAEPESGDIPPAM